VDYPKKYSSQLITDPDDEVAGITGKELAIILGMVSTMVENMALVRKILNLHT
jgi:hypothetical protein